MICPAAVLLALTLAVDPLGPGDHIRKLTVDGRERSYLVHIPPQYDPKTPTPVILLFHGAASNGPMHVRLTGMNEKSDEAGFIAVYPNGTGTGPLLFWNVGGPHGKLVDDVKFASAMIDDLASVVKLDPKRVYATGCSMGGMMRYRLAAELSDRISAIAPVAGTMAMDDAKPKRPVSVMHFHGTADKFVPFDDPAESSRELPMFKSVEETIRIWCRIDGCPEIPKVTEFPDKVDDGTRVKRKTYGPGEDGAEVVLVEVEGGGHLAWAGTAGRIHRQVNSRHLGRRLDLGVLPEAPDETMSQRHGWMKSGNRLPHFPETQSDQQVARCCSHSGDRGCDPDELAHFHCRLCHGSRAVKP